MPPPELREYQIDVEERVRARFRAGNRRGILVSPTGSGKSIVAGHIAKLSNDRGSRTLILADRRRLVKQLGGTLASYDVPFGTIMSGSTGGTRLPVICASRDTFVSWCERPELGSMNFDLIIVDECFPAGTIVDGRPIEKIEVGDIVSSFEEQGPDGRLFNRKVTATFCNPAPDVMVTVHVGPHKVTATLGHPFFTTRGWVIAGSLAVGDEVYWAMGTNLIPAKVTRLERHEKGGEGRYDEVVPNGKVYNIEVQREHTYLANGFAVHNCHKSMANTYQAILGRYPKSFVLGLTGTPASTSGRSLGDFWQWMECSVPPSKLIADGWLIKPEVYVPMELAKKRKRGSKVKGLAGDPVDHWLRHANGLPTIAFANKVSESMALRDRFLNADPPIAAEHIDASVSDEPDENGVSERDHYYKRLATGQTKVLCSVGLLIEGVDIPEASAVILWKKFGSIVQLMQAAGRIMRPADWISKSKAVILDHAGACAVHGCPGEDIPWSLDVGTTVDDRRKKDQEEGRAKPTVICGKCGAVYEWSPACPSCGAASPKRSGPAMRGEAEDANSNEILTRFDQEAHQDQTREKEQRFWYVCINTAKKRGNTAGMAAMMFSKKFGRAPWDANVKPIVSGADWKKPAIEVFQKQ